jgi:hypothetical protein
MKSWCDSTTTYDDWLVGQAGAAVATLHAPHRTARYAIDP